MDRTEQQVIDELFGKIRQAEQQSGPRDAGAESRIREHISSHPSAPYYMAQAIVIQEQALAAAQSRIERLEQEAAKPQGGFLGSLFGGGSRSTPSPAMRGTPSAMDPRLAAYTNPHHRQGSGFLGGAMQTALGVAGGVLLGNALMGMFAGDAAAAEEAAADEPMDEADAGSFEEEF